MKRFSILSVFVAFTLTAACGIQEPVKDDPTPITTTDDPTDPVDDPSEDPVEEPVEEPVEDPVEEPTYLPAPFRLAASEVNGLDGWRFSFSSQYISDAPCGEARGDWAGMLGWGVGEGIELTQGDGGYLYFEINRKFEEEVVMSYIQGADCGDNGEGWAQYGSVDQLSQMTPTALEWIYCGWADGGDGTATCNIRLFITADAVEPRGNMHLHNFNP